MKKVSVNKNGYGTYNLVINSKEYGVLTLKVVVVPSKVSAGVQYSLDKRITPYAMINFQWMYSNSSIPDGVQYTIGKVKNSNSKKFTKTYKKKTSKKFNKKDIIDAAYIKNVKRNETICVKYRVYALTSNNKKIYSEWKYAYFKLTRG